MSAHSVRSLLAASSALESVTVSGWVRTRRDSKDFSFLEVNDGSCLANLQIVADHSLPNAERNILGLNTGAAVRATGNLVRSPGKGQSWELHATELELLGNATEDYPLQKKRHSREFLREIAHLRPRTNLFGAVFRVRSRLSYAIHSFFQERGFVHVHTPIITASDCEGAGEMFRVTTLTGSDFTAEDAGDRDFFGKPTFLTVSGQLEGEALASALGRIYTFGPTFRAENSNTSRHASEFWMVEPEMAFCDLAGDMDLAEAFVCFLIQDALEHCEADLGFFQKFVDKTLMDRLHFVLDHPFQRLPYTDAVELLLQADRKFEYPVAWGKNLQAEHERWLTEEHFEAPVTLFDYPRDIKPFYMRANEDGTTVAAMDVLVPGIGEIIGGSQREERLEVLQANLAKHGLPEDDYAWYLDLRRFGSVPHAGFGLGFERMLMFLTGLENIRDVIPFPRTPRHAEF